MKVKTWMDGILKKTASAMGEGESEKIFDRCDMSLEDDPHEQGWVSILANAAGREAMEELFPDLPIRWHRSNLFPVDWATADLCPAWSKLARGTSFPRPRLLQEGQ
jgi:hypothetical protein